MNAISYWEDRYRRGGNSGAGSRGRQANKKAAYVNALVAQHKVATVVDWGCGDGVVASRLKVTRYVGLEVSDTALALCRERADGPGRTWCLYDGLTAPDLPSADLALSLDVIFHLTSDDLYRRHLALVFGSAPLVCIASSNRDEAGREHVLHRTFVNHVPAGWKLLTRTAAAARGDVGFWVFRRAGRHG